MQNERQALKRIRDQVTEMPEAIEIARATLATTPSETLTREERQEVIAAIESAGDSQHLREAARKLRMEDAWETEHERAKELVS